MKGGNPFSISYTQKNVKDQSKNKLQDYFKKIDIDKEIKEHIVFKDYDTRKKRLNKFKEMIKNKVSFNNKIYVIGFGSVGRVLLNLIIKVIDVDPKKIYIIDSRDISNEAEYFTKMGVKLIHKTCIKKDNYKKILKDLDNNDIVIECAIAIQTLDLYKYCNLKGASFVNSCIQHWNYQNITESDEYSMAYNHIKLDELDEKTKNKNTNFLISMGCNPGCVSQWVKEGIKQIAIKKKEKTNFNILDNKKWAKLSQKLGIQVIHISERDTQIVDVPKRKNEYCNTWSSSGEAYYEEGLGCVEASWGTHETDKFNKKDVVDLYQQYLIWKKLGLYVFAKSWVPYYGEYMGNIVRHDESFSIGRALTVKNENVENGKKDKVIYKPSVYYVYHPCDEAVMSVYELKERNNKIQDNYRLLTEEIINGRDILGLTYYLESGDVYWIGSILSIHEARELFEPSFKEFVNATNVPVAGGYLSGILYLIELNNKNIKKGLICPDDLPYNKILEWELPFLGEFIFTKGDFKLPNNENKFDSKKTKTDNWIFSNFLVEKNMF
jgi:homospermidine synthase